MLCDRHNRRHASGSPCRSKGTIRSLFESTIAGTKSDPTHPQQAQRPSAYEPTGLGPQTSGRMMPISPPPKASYASPSGPTAYLAEQDPRGAPPAYNDGEGGAAPNFMRDTEGSPREMNRLEDSMGQMAFDEPRGRGPLLGDGAIAGPEGRALNKFEAKLLRKEAKYTAKLARKAEKYARKAERKGYSV